MKRYLEIFTPAMARIHAHVVGDGCVYIKIEKYSQAQLKRHPRINHYETVWVINYTNTCPELIEEFSRDMLDVFGRKTKFNKKNYNLIVHSAKWIVDFLELNGKNSYNWSIPSKILDSNDECKKSWIRAFFDDEGTVPLKRKAVRARSMNGEGLILVQQLLTDIGINSNITGPYSDNSYYLNIYRENVNLYAKLISFTHPKKKKRINEKVAPRRLSK